MFNLLGQFHRELCHLGVDLSETWFAGETYDTALGRLVCLPNAADVQVFTRIVAIECYEYDAATTGSAKTVLTNHLALDASLHLDRGWRQGGQSGRMVGHEWKRRARSQTVSSHSGLGSHGASQARMGKHSYSFEACTQSGDGM